jgi:hypothetical protein
MQRRTGWLVCLVCVCAGFAAGPIGLALSALVLGALCLWFSRSARFLLYVDCALLLARVFPTPLAMKKGFTTKAQRTQRIGMSFSLALG